MINRIHHNQKGDTIIEVLISLAILTLVLGGAYYTANTSFRNDRDAQEHSEALNIAQTQVEELRSLGPVTLDGTLHSCVVSQGGSFSLRGTSANPANDSCQMQIGGNGSIGLCPAGAACYVINISGSGTQSYLGVTMHRYRVDVSWQPLGASTTAQDDVYMYYKMDKS